MGQWTGEDGNIYRDVAFIESGISREQAVWFKRKYNQESILVIKSNGNHEFIH